MVKIYDPIMFQIVVYLMKNSSRCSTLLINGVMVYFGRSSLFCYWCCCCCGERTRARVHVVSAVCVFVFVFAVRRKGITGLGGRLRFCIIRYISQQTQQKKPFSMNHVRVHASFWWSSPVHFESSSCHFSWYAWEMRESVRRLSSLVLATSRHMRKHTQPTQKSCRKTNWRTDKSVKQQAKSIFHQFKI